MEVNYHAIFFEKTVDTEPFLLYNINVANLIHRGIAQLVEQRSPKPRAVSSSLTTPAKKTVHDSVRIFTYSLFTIHFSLLPDSICVRIFEVIGNSE